MNIGPKKSQSMLAPNPAIAMKNIAKKINEIRLSVLFMVSRFWNLNGTQYKWLHFILKSVKSPIFMMLGLVRPGRSLVIALAGIFFLYCNGFTFSSGHRPVHAVAAYFIPMADFKLSQGFVHKAEGGFQIDPRDRGNWTGGKIDTGILAGTNFGISAAFLSGYRNRPVTRKEMEKLTYEEAIEIYKTKFWDSLRLGDMLDQELATLIYDCAVNQGVGTAREAMKYGIKHGGGPLLNKVMTAKDLVDAINKLNPIVIHGLIWNYRKDKYPENSVFYKGWMKRLDKLKRLG